MSGWAIKGRYWTLAYAFGSRKEKGEATESRSLEIIQLMLLAFQPFPGVLILPKG